jgi:hypothetical protein
MSRAAAQPYTRWAFQPAMQALWMHMNVTTSRWSYEVPPNLATTANVVSGSTLSGGSPSQFSACVIAETLETGDLQKWVYDTLQPSYRQRYLRMVEAITSELVPLGVRLPQTDREVVGGYFICTQDRVAGYCMTHTDPIPRAHSSGTAPRRRSCATRQRRGESGDRTGEQETQI